MKKKWPNLIPEEWEASDQFKFPNGGARGVACFLTNGTAAPLPGREARERGDAHTHRYIHTHSHYTPRERERERPGPVEEEEVVRKLEPHGCDDSDEERRGDGEHLVGRGWQSVCEGGHTSHGHGLDGGITTSRKANGERFKRIRWSVTVSTTGLGGLEDTIRRFPRRSPVFFQSSFRKSGFIFPAPSAK